MKRRSFLKVLGGGLLSIPLAKLMKGKSLLKPAAKTVAKTLPKVSGMPEWFTPLVNKIMKEGVDISPKASRVEDIEIVKKLEIPSETGKPEVITLTQNKATGNITIESNYGGIGDTPFELNYRPPKSDINLETGKEIKYPGDFQVIENRPRPTREPGDYEFDYDNFDIDSAYSDVERLEKIATGKIKDVKKIEQRAAGRKKVEESPYDDIMDRYPDPDMGDYDFADGGLASFANGGKAKKKSKAEEPLSKYKSYSEQELLENIEAKYPNQLQSFSLEDYQLNTMPMFEPKDVAPPKSYSPMPVEKYLRGREYMDLANGGVASMFRERPEYSLGGPTKAIRKISPETPMEEPLPSGLAIKSIRPTQQEIDNFVNQPIPIGQMIPVNEFLPGEDYQTYVRRKRAETGPALFAGEPVTMPVLPSTLTPQVDVSTNPIARSLEMAGFTKEEIMRIIGERGYADGGLTKTVPPAMGPDSQGVETLFRRRYS
jgi:hypothetical protein